MSATGAIDQRDFDKGIKRAEDDGHEVIYGDAHHLLLDFDSPDKQTFILRDLPPQFERHLELINQHICRAWVKDQWRSKSGTGWHVVVQLEKPFTTIERMALQAFLGSDQARGLLGYIQHLNGVPDPNLLFKPKAEANDDDILF